MRDLTPNPKPQTPNPQTPPSHLTPATPTLHDPHGPAAGLPSRTCLAAYHKAQPLSVGITTAAGLLQLET